MEFTEQDLDKLVGMISETVTKPLQQEIQTLQQELQIIKDEQQVTKNAMNADRVLSHYDHMVASLRDKKKLTVAFLVVQSEAWKYDTIYRKMVEDEYFKPIIFICPYGKNDEEFFEDNLRYEHLMRSYNYFKDSDYEYNVINTYNEEEGTFLDIYYHYSPDIVFFQSPWNYMRVQYYIHYWSQRALTCYSSYGIPMDQSLHYLYDQPFHTKLWKCFLESEMHRQLAVKASCIDVYNTEVTGFCLLDEFLDDNTTYEDNWKTTKLKRIIWAPHHYQVSHNNFSCFKKYASFMLKVVEDYKDKIEIAFRPHPALKSSLYHDSEWGKVKADAYYEKWNHMENGQLMEGNYIDYFFTSDALILDSQSFMVDYLYTKKPSLYTVAEGVTAKNFNTFGAMVFELLYKSYAQDDIIDFINNVVNEKDDPRKNERQEFIDKHLNISKSGSVSQDIIDYIKKQIQSR